MGKKITQKSQKEKFTILKQNIRPKDTKCPVYITFVKNQTPHELGKKLLRKTTRHRKV